MGFVPGACIVVGEVRYQSAVASRCLRITATGGAALYLPVIVRGAGL